LKVDNGIGFVLRTISINILPYKPELDVARIIVAASSSYQSHDYPNNVTDGSIVTKWSAIGDNQWHFIKLAEPFKISHFEIAFLPGQKYCSYFDIYASKDNLVWEPILINATSCHFSGDFQVFDLHSQKIDEAYLYVKYIGHGNSINELNTISEFKIFGSPQENSIPDKTEEGNIIIYPNPAQYFFNISIEEPTLHPDKIRLLDLSGQIVFEDSYEQGIKNVQIPANLENGVYIVELFSGNITLDTQKLIINR
jgi:hypothetical protein